MLRRLPVALSLFGALLCGAAPHSVAQAPGALTRVGTEVDVAEAEYFGLFPKAQPYASARLSPAAGGVSVQVDRSEAPDTTFTLSAEQASVLGRYLEVFEDLDAVEELDLAPIAGLFSYRKRYFAPGSVSVHLQDGPAVEGALLYVDRGGIAVWTSEGRFDWREAGGPELVVVSWREADRIETSATRLADRARRLGGGLAVAGVNLVAGTGAGFLGDAGWLNSLSSAAGALSGGVLALTSPGSQNGLFVGGDPALSARAAERLTSGSSGLAFPMGAPPEIQTRMPAPLDRSAPARPGSGEAPARPRPKRFHFTFGGTQLAPVSGQYEGTYVTGGSREAATEVSGPLAAFRLDAAYGVSRRLRAGVSARIASPIDPEQGVALAGGSSVAPYLAYVVRQAAPQPSGFDERVEATVGAGVSFGRSVVTVPFSFPASVQLIDPTLSDDERVETTAFGVGPYVQAGLAVYTTPTTSVYADVGFRLLPEVDVPAAERRYALGTSTGVAYSFDAFQARPSFLEVGVGVRWHF